ncbi:hypothetical protein ACHAWT_005573 [Skeletonema menzelii]|mmetsp:Transcript_3899/g.6443  ORF Transcript_3899/g.6443 Transcript_3899/m.6443 type:complete len:150 (+) Transcript_3899:76-525(+)|eukprot:scaffold2053_cov144-Skeletonema_menzelii.AAC.6
MKVFQTLAAFSAVIASAEAFAPSANLSSRVSTSLNMEAEIQFVRGLKEKVVPDIKLTRAVDGSSGVATFKFKNPNVFDASTASQGEITGLFLIDDEGEMSTNDVNANFINGKPQAIDATLLLRSPAEWDRFMRFMEKYGEANGLGFNKA